MERTEPITPEKGVNLLLKIWLYPNVTAFKITNFYNRSNSFFLIILPEMFILYCGVTHAINAKFVFCFLLLSLFHELPEWIFNKQINEMAFNYYAHYNGVVLNIFRVFLIIGLICFGLFFYDQIGHVKN